MSFYEALAWSGEMLLSEAYELLSKEEKALIKLANENEGDANNTADEEGPKGKTWP